MNKLSYYTILGVETNATKEEILKAYKEKAKEYHPDKNSGAKVASDMFQYLTEAKDCLIDDQQRLEHDYSIGVKKRPTIQNKESIPYTKNTHSKKSSADTFATAAGAGLLGLAIGLLISSFTSKNN